MNYNDPPIEIDETLRDISLKNQAFLDSRQYGKAQKGFERMYKILLSNQPAGKRYHKGYALHNIGVAAFYSGNQQKALKYFVLAYVEDLLSQTEGEEDKADMLPAGKTLSGVYLVNRNLLTALKILAKTSKAERTVIQDPEGIIEDLDSHLTEYLAKKGEALSVTEALRKPGQFQSEWKDRVFVGGSYSNHIAEIYRIGDICAEMGFDPVIASLFETPPGRVHHHALMLLHECRRAIFEVSDDVGQLMEIERLRDYQVTALMLCQKDKVRLSAMLKTLFESSGCQFKQYSRMEEMETHVRGFLEPTRGQIFCDPM